MDIAKHNDEEEAREQEKRRRAEVTVQPSERRILLSKPCNETRTIRSSSSSRIPSEAISHSSGRGVHRRLPASRLDQRRQIPSWWAGT